MKRADEKNGHHYRPSHRRGCWNRSILELYPLRTRRRIAASQTSVKIQWIRSEIIYVVC